MHLHQCNSNMSKCCNLSLKQIRKVTIAAVCRDPVRGVRTCFAQMKTNGIELKCAMRTTGIEPGSVGFVSTTLVHIANPTGSVNGLVNILNIDIEHQYYDFSDKYSRVYTEYLLVSC